MLAFLIAVAAIAAIGAYLAWLTARLRRLRGRVQVAREALEAQLALRATRALQSDIGRLQDAALASRNSAGAPLENRGMTESALTRALRTVDELPPELATAAVKVTLARQFHNDAVRDLRALCSRRVVRWLRLAGNVPLPAYVEFDADIPAAVRRPVVP